MADSQTNLGKSRMVLQRKTVVYFMAVCSIFRPFGIQGRRRYILWPFGPFFGHLVYFVAIGHILWLFGNFLRFGKLHREKSGNPGLESLIPPPLQN
jgi:hypothetical protein